MAVKDEIHDSPKGWVRDHIRSYVKTGGVKGHKWHGVDTLLLITRGRKTGKLRRTALIYGRDGDRFLVVASTGGAARNPEWYLNLETNPAVEVQVGSELFGAMASTATGDERSKYWNRMAEIWPDYNKYQRKCERTIPVVILDPR